MPLEPIKKLAISEPDRAAAQAAVIEAVERNPEQFLARYAAFPQSFGGRYVNSDLFKETFPEYSASPLARGRYNNVVHNAAAVLAAEQFRRMLADKSDPARTKAVFLTGIPGAGKTSTVLANGKLASDVRLVFEGQLIHPETSLQKIQQAIDAGLRPTIFVVHPTPEDALRNTFVRFESVGRGASINVMADIQGRLPEGMEQIRRHFGHIVQLNVWDRRDRSNPTMYSGWESANLLSSEGNREQIHSRLRVALDGAYASGGISEDCYRQSLGLAPTGNVGGVERASFDRHEANDRGRGFSQADRKAPLVGSPENLQLSPGLALTESSRVLHEELKWLASEKQIICYTADKARKAMEVVQDTSLPLTERRFALAQAEAGDRSVMLAWEALMNRDGPAAVARLVDKLSICRDFIPLRKTEFVRSLKQIPETVLTLPEDLERLRERIGDELRGWSPASEPPAPRSGGGGPSM